MKQSRKKKIVIIVCVVLVLGMMGSCSGGGGSNSSSTTASSQQSSNGSTVNASSDQSSKDSAKSKAEKKSAIEATGGQSLESAIAVYKEQGVTPTYYFGKNQGKPYEIGDAETYFSDLSGLVAQTVDCDSDCTNVKVYVATEEAIAAEETAAKNEETLSAKMSSTDAYARLEEYGKYYYPYGFKVHYILNDIAHEAIDENTWYLKSTCDITNQNGATAKDRTIEAYVSSNGTVSNVNIY